MNKTVKSKDRYENQIKNELNLMIRSQFKNPNTHLTSITRVELNNDYSIAKVYWDTFDLDNKENVQAEYESLAPRLRTSLAKTLTYRQMPKLVFYYDSQFIDALRIEELVK